MLRPCCWQLITSHQKPLNFFTWNLLRFFLNQKNLLKYLLDFCVSSSCFNFENSMEGAEKIYLPLFLMTFHHIWCRQRVDLKLFVLFSPCLSLPICHSASCSFLPSGLHLQILKISCVFSVSCHEPKHEPLYNNLSFIFASITIGW